MENMVVTNNTSTFQATVMVALGYFLSAVAVATAIPYQQHCQRQQHLLRWTFLPIWSAVFHRRHRHRHPHRLSAWLRFSRFYNFDFTFLCNMRRRLRDLVGTRIRICICGFFAVHLQPHVPVYLNLYPYLHRPFLELFASLLPLLSSTVASAKLCYSLIGFFFFFFFVILLFSSRLSQASA